MRVKSSADESPATIDFSITFEGLLIDAVQAITSKPVKMQIK